MARTTSLSSIPEDEELPPNPPSFPSSTRKKKNSKAQLAQSSSDSQKERATARSKLIEEAKQKAEILIESYPSFEFEVEEFPEKVCKHNKGIFTKWKVLLRTVDKCTAWEARMRKHMDLRLQNLPGEDGMFQVIPRMIFLTQFYSNGRLQRML